MPVFLEINRTRLENPAIARSLCDSNMLEYVYYVLRQTCASLDMLAHTLKNLKMLKTCLDMFQTCIDMLSTCLGMLGTCLNMNEHDLLARLSKTRTSRKFPGFGDLSYWKTRQIRFGDLFLRKTRQIQKVIFRPLRATSSRVKPLLLV